MPQVARSPCWPQSRTGAGHDVPGRRRLLVSPSTLDERSGTMRWMNGRARLVTVALAVIAAVVAGGCSGGGGGGSGDKAGGAGEPVVLRMANAYGDLQTARVIGHFVSQVKERSGGNLRVQVASTWGDFADDAEQQVVRAVAAGKVDLGWAGARVFDTIGVTSFQALQAPMLLDSYALEQAVVASDMPGQMLQSLDKVGVRGLGVLADGLRKPIAVKHPGLGVGDWRGITFGTLKSQGQARRSDRSARPRWRSSDARVTRRSWTAGCRGWRWTCSSTSTAPWRIMPRT